MSGSIILVGGPASGKTNYIARLWLAFLARKGRLRAEQLPENIEYVDDAVRHLLARKFAPRSDRSLEDGARRDLVVTVRSREGAGPERDLTVPDITGELWRRAVKTYELPQDWINSLKASSAAILFVRAHSKLNLQPMDWVTARDHFQDHDENDEDQEPDDDDYGDDEDENGNPKAVVEGKVAPAVIPTPDKEQASAQDAPELSEESEEIAIMKDGLPAQVSFCELLRYLSLLLTDRPDGGKPRVAIVVTAWDMLDATARGAGPMRYLQDQFPMFAGRIRAPDRLEIETFGMSIVGGNLRGDANKAFRNSLKGKDLSEEGYTVTVRDGAVVEDKDVTLPLAWALGD
ncbi:hypothetical protein [Novacetimonas sp. GS1]|uniref:TRAFAC clade GTPase domain-containing protein n=1 Tax=Novacetimonas sp. GS1 TaxID=3119990 RepID=UPI002FCCBBA0